MPGPFTHIYAARRVADFLTHERTFVRPQDGPVAPGQTLLPAADAKRLGELMQKWPKYAALGSQGPDLFFFLMDFQQLPGDEIMLALAALYLTDDAKREDWEPLLAILAQVNQPFANILRVLVHLDNLWKDFKKAWDQSIGPIVTAAEKALDAATGQMISALSGAVTQLTHDLELLVADTITKKDVFSFFTPKLQDGCDEQVFLWSDMLHYRKTSRMAGNLYKRAIAMPPGIQRDQFLAYTLGYICHLGTDTTGHAFVNEQCGGPFRTHGQRHHAIENHIDAWNYRLTRKDGRIFHPGKALPVDPFCAATAAFPSLAQSALYFAVQIPQDPKKAATNGDLRPVVLPPEGTQARAEALDTDGAMPDWLARGIVEALVDTYYDKADATQYPGLLGGGDFQRRVVNDPALVTKLVEKYTRRPIERPVAELIALLAPSSQVDVPPGFPLPWEVQVAYRLMLSFFKRSYMDQFDLPKPPGPGIPLPSLKASDFAWDVHSSDSPLQQVGEVFKGIGKDLAAVGNFLGGLFGAGAAVVTLPARELIYEGITLPLWRSVRAHRQLLVTFGFLTPQDTEISPTGELLHDSEILEKYIKLGDTGLGTSRNPRAAAYPYMHVNDEYRRPFAYPDILSNHQVNPIERWRTASGPHPVNTMADVLVRSDGVASNPLRLRYEQAATPADTDRLNERYVGHSEPRVVTDPLGDPILFSAYLIGRIAGDPQFATDFNLDSDRGYGYQCWDWTRLTGQTAEEYGKSYAPPVVSPTDGWKQALELHYKRNPDRAANDASNPDAAPLSELLVTMEPATVPMDKPVRITVRAVDNQSRAPVDGTVTILTFHAGKAVDVTFPTNTLSPEVTFSRLVLPGPAPITIEPRGSVASLGYLYTSVPLQFEKIPVIRLMRVGVWPPLIPAGRPFAVTVQASDAATHAPVSGDVVVNGRSMGKTNVPFTFTFGLTPPPTTVSAQGYATDAVVWPPIFPSKLIVMAQPPAVTAGKPEQLTVLAVDEATRLPVAATVTLEYMNQSRKMAQTRFPANLPSPPVTMEEILGPGPVPIPIGVPVATVSAPGYGSEKTSFAFAAPAKRRLVVSSQPSRVPLGTMVSLIIASADAETHQPVPGIVELSNFDERGMPMHLAFPTNVPSPRITLRAMGPLPALPKPTAVVKAAGYEPAEVALGLG